MTALPVRPEEPAVPMRRRPLASRLRSHVRHWPLHLALPALVTVTALAGAGVLTASIVPAWIQRGEALKRQTRAEAEQLRALRLQLAARSQRDARALRLPPTSTPEQRLPDLLEAAVRSGVVVDRIQQRLDVRGRVQVLRVNLGAAGRYGELRDFIETALRADPGLSLDRVQMRRSNPGVDRLEAELQWSVHHDAVADIRTVTSAADSRDAGSQGMIREQLSQSVREGVLPSATDGARSSP